MQIEFLALFLASATHTVKTNPMASCSSTERMPTADMMAYGLTESRCGSFATQVLADALMGIIDKDRNGKLDGRELKVRTCST